MGIKVTIDDRGVFQEYTEASSSFQLGTGIKQTGTAQNNFVASRQNVTFNSDQYVVILPTSSLGITGTLPSIVDGNLGTRYTVLVGTGSNDRVMLSGTNQINPGGAYTYVFSGSYSSVAVMAVSGTVGYYWHVLNAQGTL